MSNIFSTLALEQNPAYVDELEAKYNIKFPPIFKTFVQTFEFGNIKPDRSNMYKYFLGAIAQFAHERSELTK